jgi:hypothetical protein
MSLPKAPVLDESNSSLYRPRPGKPKHAVLRWEPAEYDLPWGTERFDGPHMLVQDGAHRYGVDLAVFFATHAPVADHEHCYIKTAPVRARRVDEETLIVTHVRGRQEMVASVPAGAWIVQNPAGEQYYNTAEEFAKGYEPIPDDPE